MVKTFRLQTAGGQIETNDIIAIQFDSLYPPVTCNFDETAVWRQPVFSIDMAVWLTEGVTIDVSSAFSASGMICDIMMIYTTPVVISPPVPILITSSPSAKSYSFQVNISNDLYNISEMIAITVESKDGWSLKDVFSISIGVNGSTLPYLPCQKLIPFYPVVKIPSAANFTWIFHDMDLPRIFITKDVEYMFSRVGSFNVSLNQFNSNGLSKSASMLVNVELEVKSISFAVTDLYVELAVGLTRQFRVYGPTNIPLIYTWNFDDHPPSTFLTTDPWVNYTFLSTGQWNVSVSARNNISEASAFCTYLVAAPTFDLFVDGCCKMVYSTRECINFKAQVDHIAASFQFDWTLSKASGQMVNQSFDTKVFSYTFQDAGDYLLSVMARNRFSLLPQTQTFMDSFAVQENIIGPILFVSSEYGLIGFSDIFVGQELTFTIQVVAGSNLEFLWDITSVMGKYKIRNINENVIVIVFLDERHYMISARISNLIDVVPVTKDIFVQRMDCNPPMLQLIGDANRQQLRSRRFNVEVIIYSCTTYQVVHKWIVSRGNCSTSDQWIDLPRRIVTNTPSLFLPARILEYGSYCIRFSSSYQRAPGRSELTVRLNITASLLKAIITGGDERAIIVDEKLVLDGTMSYDPDVSEEMPSNLNYTWTCASEVSRSLSPSATKLCNQFCLY